MQRLSAEIQMINNFGVSQNPIGSPSPREFGRAYFPFESSVLRIHEERGAGGEEIASFDLCCNGLLRRDSYGRNQQGSGFLPLTPQPPLPTNSESVGLGGSAIASEFAGRHEQSICDAKPKVISPAILSTSNVRSAIATDGGRPNEKGPNVAFTQHREWIASSFQKKFGLPTTNKLGFC